MVLIGVLVVFALALGLAGAGYLWIRERGFSARDQPGRMEETVARRLRRLAVPAAGRDRRNPVAASSDVIRSGLDHFADHCAVCHANDGSGNTEVGRNLYPKAPDMRRRETQDLTDGELFYIIENGIRFTGMPGWGTGTPEGEQASWHLVRFIRHLPKLTPEELEVMSELNPKSPEEVKEELEMQRFLEGGGEPPPPPPPTRHAHPGGANE